MNILVTGAEGFIGSNLIARLKFCSSGEIYAFDRDNTESELKAYLAKADVVFHLAGVNRTDDVTEFQTGNADLTDQICATLRASGRKPRIIMSSSIQAELDNPYGRSKLRAEHILRSFAQETGTEVCIYRFKNVFGKWCRPNYNSVVATFCYNTVHDLPLSISDPSRVLELIYIDDVVDVLVSECHSAVPCGDIPSDSISLGDLAGRIQSFHAMRERLTLPDFSLSFNRNLYATYLSYLPETSRTVALTPRTDPRGVLAEFLKSPAIGQIFLSRTRPGITRGNHFHHTKTEKFLVLEGEGLVRLRHIKGTEVVEYRLRGDEYRVLDIPPGFAHSIENIGPGEMITLFWASEIFDPDRPDTWYSEVLQGEVSRA
jgi:UDP-2-acetamido-2,6-beta-L-arabino-hexul-4-ose reductase